MISYLIFAYVMTELPASRVAAFNYLQPVIASGLGIWVLSERLTSKVLIGGGLILAGVYLAERERGEEKRAQTDVAPNVAPGLARHEPTSSAALRRFHCGAAILRRAG